jgi:glycosyltransferase involved in cell wall biosynthesis
VLLYPPASAKWVPFLRDVIFLSGVRHLAGSTAFIFHASGLPVFVGRGIVRRALGRIAYYGVDVALEVAQEKISPHQFFGAKSWEWCPCGIDVPDFQRGGRQISRPFEVLFVGSLQEGKGVLEVIRTARVLKDRGLEADFRFRIVGRWFSREFEQETRGLRAALGVEKMVELVGELTGDDKWQSYADADVFFFPTHYASEATPIVLMEALGMGLPVVTTSWAGIPAMTDGCSAAVLLPVRRPDLYADTLIKLEADRAGDLALAVEARRHYDAHFLPRHFVGRVERALKGH